MITIVIYLESVKRVEKFKIVIGRESFLKFTDDLKNEEVKLITIGPITFFKSRLIYFERI